MYETASASAGGLGLVVAKDTEGGGCPAGDEVGAVLELVVPGGGMAGASGGVIFRISWEDGLDHSILLPFQGLGHENLLCLSPFVQNQTQGGIF